MPKIEITLPFARDLTYAEPGQRGRHGSVRVIEDLVLRVEELSDRPVAVRMVDPEGYETARYVVHEGIPYRASPGRWTGASLQDAAALMRRDIERGHRIDDLRALQDKAILSDGKAEQEAKRARVEATVVLVGGSLYARAKVPNLGLRIEDDGSVVAGPLDEIVSVAASWMAFPLSRRIDMLEMATIVSEGLRDVVHGKDWRRSAPRGVKAHNFGRIEVKDAEAFAGIAYAEGGPGTAAERDAAFGGDLVRVLEPHVGLLPDGLVTGFVALRQAIARAGDVRTAMEPLVDALRERGALDRLDTRSANGIREAAYTLGERLSLFKPRMDAEPEVAPGMGR